MSPEKADADFEPFLVGQLVGLQQRAETARVDTARFFHEHVLAGLDRRPIVQRAEAGRRSLDHQVHVAGECLLVGIQPDEQAIVRHIDLVAEHRLERLARQLRPIVERVGDRDQLDMFRHAETIGCSSGSAPAGADQRHVESLAACRVRTAGDAQPRCPGRNRGTGDGTGVLQELATRRLGSWSFHRKHSL